MKQKISQVLIIYIKIPAVIAEGKNLIDKTLSVFYIFRKTVIGTDRNLKKIAACVKDTHPIFFCMFFLKLATVYKSLNEFLYSVIGICYLSGGVP